MVDWVREWVSERRKNGEKGIEVKPRGKKYYVYHSTTYWDRKQKKIRKRSSYIGVLDRERGLIESGRSFPVKSTGIFQYGNSMLIMKAMQPLIKRLKEAFPDMWEEVYALAKVRSTGRVPLKMVSTVWNGMYNVEEIEPDLDPGNLAKLLRIIGTDRAGQDTVFSSLIRDARQFAYDLTVVYSRSGTVSFSEFGFMDEDLPQINVVLFYSIDENLPTMIRVIPGSVRDITSLYASVEEAGIEGKVLVLDRGFFSSDTLEFLSNKKVSFVLPARRNSHLYDDSETHDVFGYRGRMISAGKRTIGNIYAYTYLDGFLKAEEEYSLCERLQKKLIDVDEFNRKRERAGKILILSNMDRSPEEIYLVYKKRDGVEKQFDIMKNILHSDILYLRDNESIFGHMFISFLSMYSHSSIENMLRAAGLLEKYSAMDVLEHYSRVYMIKSSKGQVVSEVPKKVRELDVRLGLNIFPTKERS